MADFITACKTMDIQQGNMKGFKVGDEDVLIANVEGQYYAVSSICTHMSGYLGKGKLLGYMVKCPVHGAEYDVRTGKISRNIPWILRKMSKDPTDLKAYKLKVENGDVKVLV